VAKSKNNVSRGSMGRSLPHTDLINQVLAGNPEKTATVRASGDTKQNSITGNITLHAIQFGKPSESSSKTSSTSGGEWTNLLKQTASGGITSALSGGLGSIGGLGSVISGIVNLFGGGGGKKTLPPLVDFQLPSSQEQTVYVGSKGSSVYQGNVAPGASGPAPGVGLYSNAGQLQTGGSPPNAQWIQEQSGQIAEAVKNALLNSSSLNDVIGEI
jgi:hypothetical protein